MTVGIRYVFGVTWKTGGDDDRTVPDDASKTTFSVFPLHIADFIGTFSERRSIQRISVQNRFVLRFLLWKRKSCGVAKFYPVLTHIIRNFSVSRFNQNVLASGCLDNRGTNNRCQWNVRRKLRHKRSKSVVQRLHSFLDIFVGIIQCQGSKYPFSISCPILCLTY